MIEGFVTVVARIKAKLGKESFVRVELLKLVTPTRGESGCMNYDMHESVHERGVFLFYENWKAEKDVDQHLQTPHVKTAFSMLADSLAEPPQLTFWKMTSNPTFQVLKS